MDSVEGWELDAPGIKEVKSDENDELEVNEDVNEDANVLYKEVEGWGMSIPEPIGSSSNDEVLFPPKFGDVDRNDNNIVELNQSSDSNDSNAQNDWYDDGLEQNEDAQFGGTLEPEMEIDPDTFWSVDSSDDSVEENKSMDKPESVGDSVTTDGNNDLPFDEEDEVVKRVREALEPVVEGLVRKFCEQKVEQVAWEIIPDLAENLIRAEIKEISSQSGS